MTITNIELTIQKIMTIPLETVKDGTLTDYIKAISIVVAYDEGDDKVFFTVNKTFNRDSVSGYTAFNDVTEKNIKDWAYSSLKNFVSANTSLDKITANIDNLKEQNSMTMNNPQLKMPSKWV
jgi:hypothetical protein